MSDSLLSNYILHEICIKLNCILATKFQHFEEIVRPGRNLLKIFFKNQLHGNISLRFGLEITEGFSECVTQHIFQKCFTKCFTDLFNDVMQNCDFLSFSLKRKVISVNRFIVPNLVNL